ncbi:sugar phosphate isomerase/epimerase family protein [Phnomibacter ginsenosidimutans]|uniref:TIM barrel protein n=1 Tax=Phnomibacter ginsenosidimutans TaxID=2676868 RepID=A0A6I6GQU2_9BACT|nr:sugar phosphate isomerase/epimerase [Phnomibacter ginsenosidimutans]QGW27419.1 TIM barrel protein [Phnomibacter ginsenosidimutans]
MKNNMYRNTFSIVMFAVLAFSCNNNAAKESVPQTTPLSIGIQLWTFHLASFTTALEKVDSCDIRYIQAISGQPIGNTANDSFSSYMPVRAKKYVQELLAKKEIQIKAYGVLNPQSREEWLQHFAFAKEMKIPLLVTEPITAHWDYADSLAGVFNIKIAIHNHPAPAQYYHPDSVLAAMKNHSHIYACADIGHWARSGLDPVKCLQTLKGRIADVHFKDVAAFNVIEADNMLLGKGVIDLQAIIEELQNQKYEGILTIEHEQNWENNVPDLLQNIKWLNDAFRKINYNQK